MLIMKTSIYLLATLIGTAALSVCTEPSLRLVPD